MATGPNLTSCPPRTSLSSLACTAGTLRAFVSRRSYARRLPTSFASAPNASRRRWRTRRAALRRHALRSHARRRLPKPGRRRRRKLLLLPGRRRRLRLRRRRGRGSMRRRRWRWRKLSTITTWQALLPLLICPVLRCLPPSRGGDLLGQAKLAVDGRRRDFSHCPACPACRACLSTQYPRFPWTASTTSAHRGCPCDVHHTWVSAEQTLIASKSSPIINHRRHTSSTNIHHHIQNTDTECFFFSFLLVCITGF
mmetsp:Transcript_3548/g.8010  ORF Transcript_3548/g.8010 Transcript_3548/m.8010 type:complete len:253 (+) Transcript_3548:250-1008(+)